MEIRRSRTGFVRALTRFVVIVVGVLVALAVDEWRENIAESNLETQYLRGLAADVDDELFYLEFVTDLARSRLEAADRLLLFLGAGAGPSIDTLAYVAPEEPDPGLLASDLVAAVQTQFFVPEAIVWEDLVNTGNLRLIEDWELRQAIARYYSQIRFQSRDLSVLFARFEATREYLRDRGIAATSPEGIRGRERTIASLTALPAHIRTVRDTQAEVLARTLLLHDRALRVRQQLTDHGAPPRVGSGARSSIE